ncbi:MAG: indole-3-glycerol phosphate synthase TrpC [Ignavibacteria bacterium]|nr:indole-3-glycerol phosphate synthase TrpC [Ignavibacteria bacterium]
MSFLDTILSHKKEEVEEQKRRQPLALLAEKPLYHRQPLSLTHALSGQSLSVIAEVKKASPSQGIIREDFDPVSIALEYVDAGAHALSVLTDVRFFQGAIQSIEGIRDRTPVPVLRKDFIIDEYQLHEAKAFGADAILLIASALPPSQLHEFHAAANELGLGCLVEVHTVEEIRALDMSTVACVGINNRDLRSFTTDLGTSLRLRQYIPDSVTVVSESGIRTAQDIAALARCGIHAVLVGETFMRAEHPGDALRSFLRASYPHGVPAR